VLGRAYNRRVQPPAEDGFADLSIRDFVSRLSSAEPVPGGGSASAVAGSLAAGLVAMVAALSEGRPRYAAHADLHAEARRRGDELAARLLTLADEDADAYAAFSAALRLPRETEAQASTRTAAMQAAARTAAEVPLRCVEACLEVVAAAESLAGRSNRNASSDLNVAALLAEAAARGAAANVLVNLPSLAEGDPFIGTATARVDALLHDIGRLAELTRTTVLSGAERRPVAPAAARSG
jgi:formiminotetrahydrofolate cyclodeaminase